MHRTAPVSVSGPVRVLRSRLGADAVSVSAAVGAAARAPAEPGT
ncbi:hypothetical protein [Streptomyces pseudovenezuelae]|nr:hypothetical protein [Streptomyces pseudovenezuelae]WUA87796.1 hypothetical protein OHO81_11060 [Streptomyces pseudovenezuelae]